MAMKPISQTAWYCTGARMQDAKSKHPVCNDIYAKAFMTEEGQKVFSKFRFDVIPNRSNAVRHLIIDEIVQSSIDEQQNLQLIVLGCGFDSRAFRLTGGVWIEIDEPAVINHKNNVLNTRLAPNKLKRIAVDFENEAIEKVLGKLDCKKQTLFVIEGVLMYLDAVRINHLLSTIKALFPQHEIVCDLMSKGFANMYARRLHQKIKKLGAHFSFLEDDPGEIFEHNHYALKKSYSIADRTREMGYMPLPKHMMRFFMPKLVNGYAVYHFVAVE